jgi:hypothetical protein
LGAGLAAAALLAAGCGTGGVASAGGQAPDLQTGGQLFKQSCGSCHTLQAAGTRGTIGPKLAHAFVTSRQEGCSDNSIENVVLDQIRLGSGSIATYTTIKHGAGYTPQPEMPANIFKGQDAVNVAAVASVAGTGTPERRRRRTPPRTARRSSSRPVAPAATRWRGRSNRPSAPTSTSSSRRWRASCAR